MNPETEYREGLEELAANYKNILRLLGEDTEREGLLKTPMRVAKAMQVLTRGYLQDPHKVLTDALFAEKYNQMVIVKDIDFFSMCEHHMLPFYGKAHVAYIPNGYITGLSKIARVVDIYSHRLQVQERLTQQIKDCIQSTLHPLGVMVVIEAKHMCMQMRGVEKQNSITTTSDFSGAFNQAKTREEFMNLLRGESKKYEFSCKIMSTCSLYICMLNVKLKKGNEIYEIFYLHAVVFNRSCIFTFVLS